MAPEKREIDRKWYITKECFADPDQHILINNGLATPRLSDLPWQLLECLLSRPNSIVQYQTISQNLWNDLDHISADISMVLNRVKRYCRSIGVEEEELSKAFESIRGEGIRFNSPFKGAPTSVQEEAFGVANNIFYFTQTCYMVIERQVLVNNDKTTTHLPEFPLRLLKCFMQRPRLIIPFNDLSIAIWGDPLHNAQDIAMVMFRIKKYFSEIEVTKEELKQMFTTYRGEGICFTPLTGIACNDPI